MGFMFGVGWIVLLFVWLVFPQGVEAAVTINGLSAAAINSAEEVIVVSASASGLSQTTHYLQAAFTKEGEATDYFGWTRNLSGSWYQYESSPSTADLAAYFYGFAPLSGTWSGQLAVKVDTSDSGFKGAGNYILKLAKFITSGPSYSNSLPVTINFSSANLLVTAESDAATRRPAVSAVFPEKARLGEVFRVEVTLGGFDAGEDYYVKVRAGVEAGQWTKGQTKGAAGYLADNDSWEKFPVVRTDEEGRGKGEVRFRISEDKVEGEYHVVVRLRKKGTEATVDSDLRVMKVEGKVALETKVATGEVEAAIKKAAGVTADSPFRRDLVLATQSAGRNLVTSVSGAGTPSLLATVMIFSGLSGFLIGAVWFVKTKLGY